MKHFALMLTIYNLGENNFAHVATFVNVSVIIQLTYFYPFAVV